MSDPKSKGSAVVETEKTEEVDLKRMTNAGKEVHLTFGTYTVRELGIFKLTNLVLDAVDTFTLLTSGEYADDLAVVRKLANAPELRNELAMVMATFCGETDYTQFEDPKPSDFIKIVKAVREVVDFEEIKSTFFELGLQKYLNITVASTETATPVQVTTE